MPNEINEIFETTYTKSNLYRKVVLLEEFFQSYFFQEHGEGDLKVHLKNFLMEEKIGDYLQNSLLSLSDSFYSVMSRETFAKNLDAIKEEVEHRPKLTLYVATVLPPVEVEKLGQWVRANVAPGIFMDLEVDKNVIGGCAFVWNGVYHDYSLRYFIQKHRRDVRGLLTKT